MADQLSPSLEASMIVVEAVTVKHGKIVFLLKISEKSSWYFVCSSFEPKTSVKDDK